jgi:hypothetical protein
MATEKPVITAISQPGGASAPMASCRIALTAAAEFDDGNVAQ